MLEQIKYKIGDFLPALRSKNYRLYFFGQGISLVGTWLQSIAEAWLIYPILTNNQSLLGIISAINLLPTLLLALLAGVIVDRIDKRKALILQQFLYVAITFVMFLLVASGKAQVWHIMIAALFMGLVFTFEQPTRQSLMVDLVEKPDYPSAIALNAGIFNAARALGPALAGILIATIGIAPAYFFNSMSFIAVIIALMLMRFPHKERDDRQRASLRYEFIEGFNYIKNHKVIAVLLGILFFLTVFSWPTVTLVPVYARDIFHRGEVGFGLLQSAFGVGALLGALAFAKIFSLTKSKQILLLTTITAAAVGLLLFGLSPVFPLSLILQFVTGWAVVSTITACNTLIQLNIPSALRGRMLSYYSLVLIGGMPFGALLGSLGVSTVGARLTSIMSALALATCSYIIIAATKGKFQEKLRLML